MAFFANFQFLGVLLRESINFYSIRTLFLLNICVWLCYIASFWVLKKVLGHNEVLKEVIFRYGNRNFQNHTWFLQEHGDNFVSHRTVQLSQYTMWYNICKIEQNRYIPWWEIRCTLNFQYFFFCVRLFPRNFHFFPLFQHNNSIFYQNQMNQNSKDTRH